MHERIDAAWRAGRTALGTHCASADIGFYEMCGGMGYDFVWIDSGLFWLFAVGDFVIV